MYFDFAKESAQLWTTMIEALFPTVIPDYSSWTSVDSIVKVLTLVVENRQFNHLYLPGGGGDDLTGGTKALEPGFLSLVADSTEFMIRPKIMRFEYFVQMPSLSYFWIECNETDKTGIDRCSDYHREKLVMLDDGSYYDRDVLEVGHIGYDVNFDEIPLPKSFKTNSRYVRGSFVLFCKCSSYDSDPSSYSGLHDKKTSDQFREYISANHLR